MLTSPIVFYHTLLQLWLILIVIFIYIFPNLIFLYCWHGLIENLGVMAERFFSNSNIAAILLKTIVNILLWHLNIHKPACIAASTIPEVQNVFLHCRGITWNHGIRWKRDTSWHTKNQSHWKQVARHTCE